MSEPVQTHLPCPSCPSSDAYAIYQDDSGYCFSCGHYEGKGKTLSKPRRKRKVRPLLSDLKYVPLRKRNISLETVNKWGYGMSRVNGEPVQVATYRDRKGRTVAQKLRYRDKSFEWRGDHSKIGLYGQWLWKAEGGKRLVITEGEIDALTVSQLTGNSWPVVSVPDGATDNDSERNSAVKAIKRELEWVDSFEDVVIMFDNDKPGEVSAAAVAELLTPGKARIASLPTKDPNEAMTTGQAKAVITAIHQASTFRPDEIVDGSEVWDKMIEVLNTSGSPYPWHGWNDILGGARQGEIVTLTAGTGVGKSHFARELALHFLDTTEDKVGYVALEESTGMSGLLFSGMTMGRSIYPGDEVDMTELREAYDKYVGSGRLYLYDHFGSMQPKRLLRRINYMVKGLGVRWVFLDHVSIVLSGMAEGDERRQLDNLMTDLRSLVENTGVGLFLVSHLKRVKGTPHEEGGRVRLADLRGSQGIPQLSDVVVGLERNPQSDDGDNNITVTRCLKKRLGGQVGVMSELEYDPDRNRLVELEAPDLEDAEDLSNDEDESVFDPTGDF